MCFLGIGCSQSTSNSSNSTNNDNSVTDNRVLTEQGATYVGAGASVSVDASDRSVSTVDDHHITDSHNITYVTDSGAVAAATSISKAGLDTAATISGKAIIANQGVSETAIKAASDAAAAASAASARTAQNAIDAITRSQADSSALARSLGTDAIQFGHDVASGFISAQSDLNKLVGTLAQKNDEFLVTSTDKLLARSQSADQQNFEATLNLLKWVAVALAGAFAVSKFAKA